MVKRKNKKSGAARKSGDKAVPQLAGIDKKVEQAAKEAAAEKKVQEDISPVKSLSKNIKGLKFMRGGADDALNQSETDVQRMRCSLCRRSRFF
jgi:hypothetical protein